MQRAQGFIQAETSSRAALASYASERMGYMKWSNWRWALYSDKSKLDVLAVLASESLSPAMPSAR